MLKLFGRVSLASALVLFGTSSLFAQGAFILGVDDWTYWGGVDVVGGPWSGVTVSEVEPNDDYLTANAMAVGDDFSGAIATGGTEVDYAAFTVAMGDSIIAETIDIGGMSDTKLYLYDTDGVTQLAYDDDGGVGLKSKISYTFSTAGTFYLTVAPYNTSHDGAYLMELRTVAGTGVVDSWVYIQKALEAVAAGVTRAGADGSVAVLGSADSTATYDAGAAYHYCVPAAAANSSLTGTVNFYDTDVNIAAFFTDLGLGTVNPSIIVLPGAAAGNDVDAAEALEFVNNAAAIGSFISSGGGLISHGDGYYDTTTQGYAWLPLVFPGAGVVQEYNSPTLTNEGKFHLPGWEDADHFSSAEGFFTGLNLDVYMTAPGSAIPGPWSGVTVNEVEANDDYLTANPMAIGDDAAGSIDNSGADYDFFAFSANAGDVVSLATVDVAGLSDTTLELYDTDGVTSLVFNDDGGPGLYSLIDYTFTAPGTYFVAVGSFGTGTGLYSLQTRTATANPGSPVVVGSLPSAWTWLGNDLAGVNGKPLMVPTGTLAPASPWTLSLTDAAPSTTAFLITGLSTVYLPIKGGVLVPANHVLIPLPTNASGELSFGGVLGAPPSGATFYMQYWIIDAAGPFGFSASNGLSGTTP